MKKIRLFSKRKPRKLINIDKAIPFPWGECPRCHTYIFLDNIPMYCEVCKQRLSKED